MREKLALKLIRKLNNIENKLFKNLVLQLLLNATARGFNNKKKIILFDKDPLKTYGEYTLSCLNNNNDYNNLFTSAFSLGEKVRNLTGLSKQSELKELIILLYKYIGIDIKEIEEDEFEIGRCYFSKIYSPKYCEVMSKMDEGIFVSILGQGKLVFKCRITENGKKCIAHFKREER